MKITEDVRKYAAEQGIKESEALASGMQEKAKEFIEKGRCSRLALPAAPKSVKAGRGVPSSGERARLC